MGAIEWPGGVSSTMSVTVLDNTLAPVRVLDPALDTTVHLTWTVPPPHNVTLGGDFRLRAFVESLGPGQEMQVGPTVLVLVVGGQSDYSGNIVIPAGTLLGEGELYPPPPTPGGVPVSGVYKIVAVLQHRNPGPTVVSGFAETSVRMYRKP
jgi:hypothetical protein